MFESMEFENSYEITTGIVDHAVKLVTISKESYIITVRQYSDENKIQVMTDALVWVEAKNEYQPITLTEDLKKITYTYVKEIMDEEPMEKTTYEIREELIANIWKMIDYWDNETRRPTAKEKMQGLVHSILAALDGCYNDLPRFIIAPNPSETEIDNAIDDGRNFFPYNDESLISGNVGGSMHELFYEIGRKLGYVE